MRATMLSYCRPWDKDRFMAPDIDNVTALLKEQRVWDAVKPYLDKFALVQVSASHSRG